MVAALAAYSVTAKGCGCGPSPHLMLPATVAALLSVVPDTVPLMREPGCRRWEYGDYCDAVEIEVARFVDMVRGVDPTVAVPSCP